MSIYAAGSSIPPRTVTVGTVEFIEAGSYRATDLATGAAVTLPGFVVVVPTCAASAGGAGDDNLDCDPDGLSVEQLRLAVLVACYSYELSRYLCPWCAEDKKPPAWLDSTCVAADMSGCGVSS